jgi:hypothetical protein
VNFSNNFMPFHDGTLRVLVQSPWIVGTVTSFFAGYLGVICSNWRRKRGRGIITWGDGETLTHREYPDGSTETRRTTPPFVSKRL